MFAKAACAVTLLISIVMPHPAAAQVGKGGEAAFLQMLDVYRMRSAAAYWELQAQNFERQATEFEEDPEQAPPYAVDPITGQRVTLDKRYPDGIRNSLNHFAKNCRTESQKNMESAVGTARQLGVEPSEFDAKFLELAGEISTGRFGEMAKGFRVSLAGKGFREATWQDDDVRDSVTLALRAENYTGQTIRALQGEIYVVDLFGNVLSHGEIQWDDPIPAGVSRMDIAVDFNMFFDEDVDLASRDSNDLMVTIFPTAMIMANGQRMLGKPNDSLALLDAQLNK